MSNDQLSSADHRRLSQFVTQQAGIQLPESKKNLIEARLRKRQLLFNMDSLAAYIDFALSPGSDEPSALIDALTTNKTEFLRESAHFDLLAEQLPLQWHKVNPLKVWSAGCSTGEEPYTMAMVLANYALNNTQWDFTITATDISQSSLDFARQAVYPFERITPIPESWRRRYLLRSRDRTKNTVRIGPELRHKVQFGMFNLIRGNYASLDRFHVIFCRNVMIYFSAQQRQALMERFYQQLLPGGVLCIGLSEGMQTQRHQFSQISPSAYRKV